MRDKRRETTTYTGARMHDAFGCELFLDASLTDDVDLLLWGECDNLFEVDGGGISRAKDIVLSFKARCRC